MGKLLVLGKQRVNNPNHIKIMAKKDIKNKGISRIDSGSTHGWFVRGYRNGKTYSKLFSDLKLGGKKKAMDQARDYRDNLLKELEKIPAAPRGRRPNQ